MSVAISFCAPAPPIAYVIVNVWFLNFFLFISSNFLFLFRPNCSINNPLYFWKNIPVGSRFTSLASRSFFTISSCSPIFSFGNGNPVSIILFSGTPYCFNLRTTCLHGAKNIILLFFGLSETHALLMSVSVTTEYTLLLL